MKMQIITNKNKNKNKNKNDKVSYIKITIARNY
jgi:hypothetical protein